MATRPRWIGFTLLVLGLIVVFVLLGRWQLDRARSQALDDVARTRASDQASEDVSRILRVGTPPAPGEEWRAVTAVGEYDATHQLLVRNRSLNSTNGYLVLVPMRVRGGPDLVVVRGWIPSGSTAAAPDAVPAVPEGTVRIAGRLRLAEPSTGPSDLPAGQVERIVPSEVGALTGRPTYAAWVVLGSEDPAAAGAAAVTPLPDGSAGGGWRWPISHTVYAWQWFTFAMIALVGWVVLLRRDVSTDASDRDAVRRDA